MVSDAERKMRKKCTIPGPICIVLDDIESGCPPEFRARMKRNVELKCFLLLVSYSTHIIEGK